MIFAGFVHCWDGDPLVFADIVHVAGGELLSELDRALPTTDEDVSVLEDAESGEAAR